jgi:hypothetical protein
LRRSTSSMPRTRPGGVAVGRGLPRSPPRTGHQRAPEGDEEGRRFVLSFGDSLNKASPGGRDAKGPRSVGPFVLVRPYLAIALTLLLSRSRTGGIRALVGRSRLGRMVAIGVAAISVSAPFVAAPAAAGGLCSAADALRNQELWDEADAAYHALVRYHPAAATCAAQGLKALNTDRPKAQRQTPYSPAWVEDRFQDFWPWLALAAAVVALGLVLSRARAPALRFGEFRGPPSARPSLGDELASALRYSLLQLRGLGGSDLDVVSKWADAVEVPAAITGVAPQGKVLAAIVSLLGLVRFRRRLELAGELRLSDDGTSGVTLTLGRSGGRVVNTVTLWSRDFEERPAKVATGSDGDPSAVALAGATWLRYALTADRGYTRVAVESFLRWYWKRSSPPMGTGDWFSLAQLLAGAATEKDARIPRSRRAAAARARYLGALEQDARNWGALFNLAFLDSDERRDETQTVGERQLLTTRALERLKTVRTAVEKSTGFRATTCGFQTEPTWYRAVYRSVAQQLNDLHLPASGPDVKKLDSLKVDATLLVRTLEHTLRSVAPGELRSFLERFEAIAVTLLASVEAARAKPDADWRPNDAMGEWKPTRDDLRRHAGKLRYERLLAFLGTSLNVLPAGTRYDIAACRANALRSGQLPDRKVVLQALRFAVEDRSLAETALKDPSFESLRNDPEFQRICAVVN